MASRFPLFADGPLKTLDELESEIQSSRLLGLGLLVGGSILVGVGLPQLKGFDLTNTFVLAGGIQAGVGALLAFLIPAMLRRRWQRRLGGR